ncbi:hypothetical protein OBRU01_07037 [Operophtera brumata]|uniref:Zinc finger PHD-type domain-containing protein n=1 Tax=Operophtera brumata TaxID=104452 RepID=A0A0L7LK17_OPEBR|nr:hypothetical protein OBRU01_07037 [Operophtera brumata]
MGKCSVCRETLPTKEQVKCTAVSCLQIYHFQCVGLSTLRSADHSTWKCPKCKLKESKGMRKTDSPVIKSVGAEDVAGDSQSNFVTVRPQRTAGKDDDSSEILASMRDEILAAVTDQLPKIIRGIIDKKLEALGSRIQSMEDSVRMVSDKYDETRKNFDTQNSSIKKLQSENKQLKDCVKGLELRLSTAEDFAAKQEQWAKQQNLEIIGIPEVSGESLSNIVINVAKHAAMPLQAGDIEFAHRVTARRPVSGKPRAIIVRFRERITKDFFLSAMRKKRGLTSKDVGVDGDLSVYTIHITIKKKIVCNGCTELH